MATWFSYFGGITFAVGAVLLLFRICGGQTALRMLLSSTGMPSWASSFFSGNLLDLCSKKAAQEENVNGPQTIIQINRNGLDDDDSNPDDIDRRKTNITVKERKKGAVRPKMFEETAGRCLEE